MSEVPTLDSETGPCLTATLLNSVLEATLNGAHPSNDQTGSTPYLVTSWPTADLIIDSEKPQWFIERRKLTFN